MEELVAARQARLASRGKRRQPRPAPLERHPVADAVTANVARLAAEEGLAVEEVAKRAVAAKQARAKVADADFLERVDGIY